MEAATKIFKQAIEHGFTEGEYNRARTEILTNYDNSLQAKDSRTSKEYAMEYANFFTTGGYIPGIEVENQYIHALAQQIPVDLINQTMKQMVIGNSNNLTVFLMAPTKDGITYPNEAQLLEEYNAAFAQATEPYVEKVVDTKLIDQMPAPGTIVKETPDQPYGSTLLELSNGVKVYLQPQTHDKNKVVLYGFSEGGLSAFDAKKDNVTARALDYADLGGIGKFTPTDLEKALTGRTASAATAVSEFDEIVSGNSTTRDIETMLQLAYLRMTDVREDGDLFITEQKNALAQLEAAKANPLNAIMTDSIPALFFPGDVLHKALTADEIKSVDYKHILDVYRNRFADAGDFTFILSGDFDPEVVKPLVAQYLGALPDIDRPEKADYTTATRFADKGRVTHFTVPMDNPIGFVVDAFALDGTYNLKSRFVADILAEVLNQTYLVSIREEEGGTYGVSVQSNVSRHPEGQTNLLILFQTNPESAERLNDIVKKQLQDIVDNGVNEEYFKKTILNLEKNYTEGQTTNAYWMNLLKNQVRYGETDHEIYLDTLHSITLEDVKALLNDFLTKGRYFEMIATGVKK